MKWKDQTPRPYYEKYEKVPIGSHQEWFEVYRLPDSIYAICEPQHFQEVNSFLICGSKRALLLDTGMGIRDISKVVEELYEGEVIVFNSHFHFDHIGDNHRFATVHAAEDEYARTIAREGLPKEGVGNQLEEDMFLFDYPQEFDPDTYHIPPYQITIVDDGEQYDLGDRRIEVNRTPGHSSDCIMLYDLDHHILFTGDMFYLGALYAHFNCKEFGRSDSRTYARSLKRIVEKYPEAKYLVASHNDFIAPIDKLREAAQGFENILSDSSGHHAAPNSGHSYLEEEGKIQEHQFDGFSIVVKNE